MDSFRIYFTWNWLNTTYQKFFKTTLYKNSFYIIGGTVIAGMTNFLFWLLAARLYSPEIVGITSALVTSSLLLVSLFDLGFGTAIVYYASRYKEDALNFIHPIFRAGWLISLLSGGVFLLGTSYWAKGLSAVQSDTVNIFLFLLLTLSNYLLGLQDAVMLSRKDASFVFWRNVASNVPSFLLLLAFSSGAPGMYLPLLAFAVPNILVNLFAGTMLVPRKIRGFRLWGSLNLGVIKQVSGYSLSNYSANLIWGSSNYILPLIAINFLSSSEVAYFYITWSIFNFVLVIPRGVNSSFFIEKVDRPEHIQKAIYSSLGLIFGLSVPLILLLSVFGPFIMSLFGQNYVQTNTLILLLISIFPFTINGIYFMVKRIRRELLSLNIFSLSLTVLIIAFAAYFSRRHGIQGLAVGWLASQLAGAAYVVGSSVVKLSVNRINLRFNPTQQR